jgi:hypothetical protein
MRRHRGHWAVLLGVVIAALATSGAALATGATGSRGAGTRLLGRCAAIALGLGGSRAAAAPGSADPGVEAQFALLRRPRTAADALPAGADVPLILSSGGAGSFDPAASVKVESLPHHATLYAVPATVRSPVLPAVCASLPQGPDLAGVVALDAEAIGSGPGVCLVTVARALEIGRLPGKQLPHVLAQEASCASATVLAGYPGATGLHREAASSPFLVPDGITSLTDTFADGRQVTIPVSGNLATAPRVKAPPSGSTRLTIAQLRADLIAAVPTTVTEVGAAGAPVATLARPDDLVGNLVASFRLLRSALRGLTGATSTGSSGATVSCQSGTHRCTSVTLSSACHSGPSGGLGGGPPRCRLDRRIRRFRRSGSTPAGHAGAPNPLLTAPIRARVAQRVTHPGKLTLVLKGAPQDHVGVFASVNCFSGASAASGNPGLPIVDAAVPSRTPLTLPGPASTHHTCVVNALVTSTRHDAIRVSVARG